MDIMLFLATGRLDFLMRMRTGPFIFPEEVMGIF